MLLQPTLYWKNAKAQKLPFTLDIKTIYRGTTASIFNECQMMGFQFLTTGFFRKCFESRGDAALSRAGEFGSAAAGGVVSAFLTSPVELIMIQQQKFGQSFISTPIRVASNFGVLSGGLMRGLIGSCGRDSIYVCGMLGVTPIVQVSG